MLYNCGTYLNLKCTWSSCRILSTLPCLEFLPSHWGNSILPPIPPLIKSEGITQENIACRVHTNTESSWWVLWKLWQPTIFSIYSTLQCQLHVAVTLVLFRWLVVSINREMALMWRALLNYADFYFCYVIKTLVPLSFECMNKHATALPRCTRARLPPKL